MQENFGPEAKRKIYDIYICLFNIDIYISV